MLAGVGTDSPEQEHQEDQTYQLLFSLQKTL